MRTPVLLAALALPLSLLLVPLALPSAEAGVVQTASCALRSVAWADPTVDAIWQATATYSCTVGGIVAGQVRTLGCAWINHPFVGPVGDAIDATQAYKCILVTILA